MSLVCCSLESSALSSIHWKSFTLYGTNYYCDGLLKFLYHWLLHHLCVLAACNFHSIFFWLLLSLPLKSLITTMRLAIPCCREWRLENHKNLSVLRPGCLLVCIFRLMVSLCSSGSFSFSRISSSSSSAAYLLFWSLKKLGPVSQFDPVRLWTFSHCVLRSVGFLLVLKYFHWNLPDCLYTVSNVSIEPLALVSEVIKDNLLFCVEHDLVNLHACEQLVKQEQWNSTLGRGCLWSEQVLPLIDQRARSRRFLLYHQKAVSTLKLW